MARYGLVFLDTLIPTVLVRTVPGSKPVHRARGFTRGHAFSRAVKWARAHGDPR
jgi:hypothetical protein